MTQNRVIVLPKNIFSLLVTVINCREDFIPEFSVCLFHESSLFISWILIMVPPWFQACIYWKKPVIGRHHFFFDSVIVSRERLQQSIFQRHIYFTTFVATIHYNKRSVVDSRKNWRVCLFEENHCSPAL